MFTENQIASSHGKHDYYPSNSITAQQRVCHPPNDIKSKKRLLSVKRHKAKKTCLLSVKKNTCAIFQNRPSETTNVH